MAQLLFLVISLGNIYLFVWKRTLGPQICQTRTLLLSYNLSPL